MQISTFLLVMLFIFIVLTFIFITFNNINPRKYITYTSMGHLLAVVTIIITIMVTTDRERYVALGIIAIGAFLWSNFFVMMALSMLISIEPNKKYILSAIALTIFDLFLAITTTDGTIVVHKFIISTLYIVISYKFYKQNNKLIGYKMIVASLVIFPVIQYYYGFMNLFVLKMDYVIDLCAYVLQSVTLSVAIILVSYEEAKYTLQNNIESMEFISNNIGDLICQLDNEYRIIYVTNSFKKVLGYEPEELLYKGIKEIIVDEDYVILQTCMNSFIGSGIEIKCEHRMRGKNNKEIHVQTLINRTVDDNEVKYILCLRDISKEKYLDNLEKKYSQSQDSLNKAYELDKIKTEFITNISHELRTPINIIFSSIQLYEVYFNSKNCKSDNCEKMNSYLTVMRQNCCRLIRLVNNLIDLSKLEAGFMNSNLSYCDIVSVAEDISTSTVPYAEERGIYIEFEPEFEEKLIMCDIDNLERILLNLIANAIKYSNEGGTIRINLKEEDNFIVISVKDEGTGIPAAMQEKIFERFSQVEGKILETKEGSGIGLYLVKNLVELQRGTIRVISELGKGSEFIFTIPVLENLNSNINKDELIRELDNKKIEIELSDL